MPLPFQMNSEIERAVSSVLQKEGLLNPQEEFSEALTVSGITINELANQLSSLIYSSRDRTKLEAIKIALAGKGIDLREKDSMVEAPPTIIFNIATSHEQTLNMFAPPREVKSLIEMSTGNVNSD